MIRPFTIAGGAPTALFYNDSGAGKDPVQVYNAGDVSVYLGEDANMAPGGSSIPLRPGSATQWAAGVPLYAIADTGQTSKVIVTDSAQMQFDAGGVAGQLLAQGLPAAFAKQIRALGAPPVDAQAVLVSATVVGQAGVRQSVVVDVSAFQSITVYIREASTVTRPSPSTRLVQLEWGTASADGALFYVYDAEQFYTTDSNNTPGTDVGYTTYQTAVKNPLLKLDLDPSGVQGQSVTVLVTGSYKTFARPRYVHRSAYNNPIAGDAVGGSAVDGIASIQFNGMPGNSSRILSVPSLSGPATFNVDSNSQCDVFLFSQVPAGVEPVIGKAALGSVSSATVPMTIPRHPVAIRVNAYAGGVGYVRASVTFDSA